MSSSPGKKVKRKNATGRFSEKELISIREALLARRTSLLEQQERQLDALNSPERHHIADLEEMGSDGDADSLCTLVDLSSSNIDQIDSALEKLATGSYGICEECERPIPPARLEYLPFAALCVDCKREQETQAELADASEG